MADLKDKDDVSFVRGNYTVQYYMAAGTAEVQMSVDGKDFKLIPNSDASAETNFKIEIPNCLLKVVVTGDATAVINRLGGSD